MGGKRWLPWVVCGVLGCSADDDTGPSAASTGALEVITSTTGSSVTPSDYFVTVDDQPFFTMPPNGADTVTALSAGEHTVLLDGMPANCVLDGENPRPVDIPAGETISIRFDISCNAALQVSVSTTGSELDPDGYDVTIDNDALGPVPSNGTILVPFAKPGPHTITLSGIAPNCAVSGEHPRTVNFDDTEPLTVQLEVVCDAAGTLLVAIPDDGSGDPDPDGFVITLNGGPRMGISPVGQALEFLRPGDYKVTLSDVAPHCTLSGPDTATATVVSGGRGTVSFTVRCGQMVAGSPGQEVLVARNTEIYLLSADGSRFVNLTNTQDEDSEAEWSPDGRTIVFRSGRYVPIRPDDQFSPSRFLSHIFVMNADGTGQTQLTHSETPEPLNFRAGEHGPAWSPDGRRIAYIGTTPDSSQVVFVMNADGSGKTQLTTGRAVIAISGKPAWSPDGSRIAYGDWTVGHQGIFLINADGSGVTRLTDGIDAGAAWSPDGTRIAFIRTVVGIGDDVYVVNADGSGLARLTTAPGDSRHFVAWSPDGTKIGFELGLNIYVVNANGTGLTQLTFAPEAELLAFWGDDSKIAYYVSDLLQNQLYLMNLDGSGETPVSPPWSPGGPSSPAARR